MSEEHVSKELVLTAPSVVARRSKPTLVQVGNRYLSSDGKWHPELAGEYILAQAKEKWLTVGELARVFYGANIPTSKERVRRRLYRLFDRLMGCGEILLHEVDPSTRRIQAVKLYDPNSESDRQTVRDKLKHLEERRDITADQFQKAICLTGQKELKVG